METFLGINERKNCLKHLRFDNNTTKGRRFVDAEENLEINPFILDLNKIKNSKAHRRSGHKTQVFSNKDRGPYTRTRLSHSDEINVNALILSDFMGLNNNLVAAQTQGHDLGHVVFGHLGENFISEKTGLNFKHFNNSSYVLEFLERYNFISDKNEGLNLSYETHEGILYHSRGKGSFVGLDSTTQETTLTMLNDKIGYIFSDYNDCINRGYIDAKNEPKCFLELGKTQRQRVNMCNIGVILESSDCGFVSFEKTKLAQNFIDCKDFMYGVYDKIDKKERGFYWSKLEKVYNAIYESRPSDVYDPILLIIMMTEEDLDYLSEKSFIRMSDIENTSLKCVLKNIKAVDQTIEIGTFDLSLCCKK